MSLPLILPDIDPVLIHLGPVAIRWYALAYVAGVILGWYYISKLLKREALWAPNPAPMTNAQLEDLILWLFLGIFLGGRIGYVLIYDFQQYIADPLQILNVMAGGMSFHGGFLGVVVAGIWFTRRNKLNGFSVGDLLASAAPIGLCFGRLANFINGELWGRPTDVPWGTVFCNKYILEAYNYCPAGDDTPRHPSQLYEAALEGVLLFGALYVLTRYFNKQRQPGFLMGVFIAGYGLIRILLETVRNPDAQMPDYPFGLTMGMILSLPMVIAGGVLIWMAVTGKTQKPPTPDAT